MLITPSIDEINSFNLSIQQILWLKTQLDTTKTSRYNNSIDALYTIN
jgi:hypothetical protein